MIKSWEKSKFLAPILIAVIVLLANILYISGYSNPNPLNTRSGLSNSLQNNVFSGQNNIDPNDGFLTQALGKESAEDIIHGKLPWWDYDQQVGSPLAGAMQSASFFPPVLILYFSTGMTYFHIFLEMVAGIATYYLLLRLGLRKLTSSVGGVVFALSSVFVWFWTPNTNPIALLPLLILGIEIAYARAKSGKKHGWLILAVALALSIYAGFPEVTGLDTLLAVCWAVVRLFQANPKFRARFFKKMLLGAATGLLLASPIIVAFLDYFRYANVGDHATAITASVNTIGIPAFFMPYIYGPIFGLNNFDASGNLSYFWSNVGGYITGLSLFLAAVGLIGIRKKSEYRAVKILLAVWVVIMFLRIYGLLGFNTLMAHIPFIDNTAIYRYIQPSVVFAVVILMCFGLEYILTSLNNFKKLKKVYWIAAASIVVLIGLLPIAFKEHHRLIGAHHERLWFAVSVVWCLATIIAVVAVIFLASNKKITKRIAGYAIAAIIIVDSAALFIVPQFSAPRSATINTAPVTYLQKHIGEYRFYSMGPIMPNYGSYFNIAAINVNSVPVAKAWTSYAETKLNSNMNPLVFTGQAGNSLSLTGPTPAQELIKNLGNYEYIGVKYVAINAGSLTSTQAAQANLKKVFNDSTATIYELPNPSPYYQVINGNCTINSTSKTQLTAYCSKPSTILRRELYMPGWTANINGANQVVKQSGPLFQSISLPKGSSNVTVNFTPPHMLTTFILFFLTIIGVLICYIPFINKPISKYIKLKT